MKPIKKIMFVMVCLFGGSVVLSCTDLNEELYSVVAVDDWGKTQEQRDALVGPLYASLSDYFQRFEALNCVTDEQVAPSRGGDWAEPEWRFLEEHTWPIDYWQFDEMWKWCYNNVAKINQQIAISDVQTVYELRALRAFYHYIILDNFGNGIIADQVISDGSNPEQSTRKELFDFVESELLAVKTFLSKNVDANYGRMSRYVVHMLLAKIYLNAEVYTGTQQWDKARANCDSIISSGAFTVTDNFLSNFSTRNETSSETILAAPFDKSKKTGFYNSIIGLHYLHQQTYELGYTPWNGYCTYAEFYDSFEDGDIRKNMWITGQITDANGTLLFDDTAPAILTKDIPAFQMPAGPVARLAGYRNGKYEIEIGGQGDQSNDFVIFRISDVYLMRGEAYFKLGNQALALEDINFIRTKRNVPAFSSPLTADMILAERGRELAFEFHRRQDLIRFGQFTKARIFKPLVTPAYRQLYPIPFNQVSLNPNLTQNPGY